MAKIISLDEVEDDFSVGTGGDVAAEGTAKAASDKKPAVEKTAGDSSEPAASVTAPEKLPGMGALPEAAAGADNRPVVASRLPSSLKDALAALQKAEALPQATKEQKVKRDAELARIRPHVARLQEGVPIPVVTAQALGNYHHKLISNARRERLEILARSNPEIAELSKERDELAEQLEKLKKP